MQSKQRERALLVVVDGLEAELRRVQLWAPDLPSEDMLASSQPFCIDTLALSHCRIVAVVAVAFDSENAERPCG